MASIIGNGSLTFTVADYVLLFLMLILSAAIGVYYAISGGKQRTAGEFLMGSRQMPVIPVGISLVASMMSAITYLGMPSDVYFNGSMLAWFAVSHVIACFVVGRTFIPVFYRLQLTSVYEYLELRFNKVVRRCGVASFYISMCLYLGIVIYAPCLAFSAVTGVSFVGAIFAVSLVCIFYTTLHLESTQRQRLISKQNEEVFLGELEARLLQDHQGGMKAVIWADFFQMMVIVAGMMALIIKGSMVNNGFQAVWNISSHGQRIEFFNIDPDPTVRHTMWSMLLGGTTLFTKFHGINQYQVQRFLSLSSLKSCYWALAIYAVGMAVIGTILPVMCGLIAYAHYHDCDPLTSGKIIRRDQVLVYLVLDLFSNLPGLPGLFLSAVFSAALSTFSSALNALAAVTGEDIVKSIWPDISEKKYTIVLKCLAATFGLFTIGMVFVADALGKIMQTALALNGALGGPLFGMFCLGLFNPKANSKGTLFGFFTGIAFGLWIIIGAQIYPPESSGLPLSIAGCVDDDYSGNLTEINTVVMTTEPLITSNLSSLSPVANSNRPVIANLYSISYLWYCLFTSSVTILIGSITSLFIGTSPFPDRGLLSPVCESFCCCFGWLPREDQMKPKKMSNDNYLPDIHGEPEVIEPLSPKCTETTM